jgi:hypothetical protein
MLFVIKRICRSIRTRSARGTGKPWQMVRKWPLRSNGRQPNGIAQLDGTGKVPESQLPPQQVIPDASASQKGIVQLSNSTNSDDFRLLHHDPRLIFLHDTGHVFTHICKWLCAHRAHQKDGQSHKLSTFLYNYFNPFF